MIDVVLVLGNRSSEIFEQRAMHAINVFFRLRKFNDHVYFIPKYYDYFDKNKFLKFLNDFKQHILDDNYYTDHKVSHDTINEALATRYLLEKIFYLEHKNDIDFKIRLHIVTSHCHEKRTRYLFDQVFIDINWIELYYDSSETTETEIKSNRCNIELNILKNQSTDIIKNGGIHNFINKFYDEKIFTIFKYIDDGESKILTI